MTSPALSPSAARASLVGPVLPDRSNPLPLWAQVCGDLRRRIEFGEFAAGFPGELSLTEEYEVSRHTIREALREVDPHFEGIENVPMRGFRWVGK